MRKPGRTKKAKVKSRVWINLIIKINNAMQSAVAEYTFTNSVASFEVFQCIFTMTARRIAGTSANRANTVGYSTEAPSPYM